MKVVRFLGLPWGISSRRGDDVRGIVKAAKRCVVYAVFWESGRGRRGIAVWKVAACRAESKHMLARGDQEFAQASTRGLQVEGSGS